MEFDFQQIIDQLNQGSNGNFALRMARAMVTPSDYLFNSILPDVNMPTYDIKGGNMTITPTMLQSIPMDTPPPPMGAISSSTFFENTTKVGGSLFFTEKQQRDLLDWEMSLRQTGAVQGFDPVGDLTLDPATGMGNPNTINGRRINAVLGLNLMMEKAHWDTREYLKGKALSYGQIAGNDFAFASIPLDVSYDIPTANVFTTRTGNDGYGGSSSKFWTDIRALYRILKYGTVKIYMNSNTYFAIIDQSFNNIRVVDETVFNKYHVERRLEKVDQTKVTQNIDKRDKATVNVYDRSGAVLKTTNNVHELQYIPFLDDGRIFVTGELMYEGFTLVQGPVLDPDLDLSFGYNHIAPTVEGRGVPGIWSRIFTPEQKPYQVLAETVSNFLPAILNPKKLVLLSTELPS